MPAESDRHPEREWVGGAYDRREGITVTPDKEGITIEAWYDGGIGLEVMARLSWTELEDMRPRTASNR